MKTADPPGLFALDSMMVAEGSAMTTTKAQPSVMVPWKVLAWALQTVLTMLIGVLGWNVAKLDNTIGAMRSDVKDNNNSIVSNDKRITAVEANRFTAADGLKMQSELVRMWQELANYPTRDEVPSPLFLEKVNAISSAVDKLSERILALEREPRKDN